MKSTYLHLLNADGSFNKYQTTLQQIFDDSLAKIAQLIPVEKVDVVVRNYKEGTIPEVGIGGYAPDKKEISITINLSFPNIEQVFYTEFPDTLAHELHHVARWKSVGYGRTLFEAIVSEGLADDFATRLIYKKPHLWDTALHDKEILKYFGRAKKEFSSKDYNHNSWFFGDKKLKIPRWTGYSLGNYVVQQYSKKKTLSLESSYKVETNAFIAALTSGSEQKPCWHLPVCGYCLVF